MIRRGLALPCLLAAGMIQSRNVDAGVWGVDPVVGITGDYSSNPAFLDLPHAAGANGALLLDAPVTYTANDFKLFVDPSFRVGDASGYSSVTSNYEHLNVKGEFDTERSVFTAAAGAGRDSSLYYDYLFNGTVGVRRDSATADLNWDRQFTERIDVDTDVNATRVRYGTVAGVGTLVDYSYSSITPTLSWATTERGKLTLAASVGRYNSLDGTTESRNGNLQVGFVRKLSELWSLTATGGYSRALNRIDVNEEFLVFTKNGPAIEVIPVRLESAQNGTIYSVNLSRQGSLLLVNAIASRQVTPTGFALLSRQNILELKATDTLSERWSVGGDARYVKSQDPLLQGKLIDSTLKYFALSANWQWTEHWMVTMAGSRVSRDYQSINVHLAANEVSITLSRQFNHIKFQ